jgi:hypothetical protein
MYIVCRYETLQATHQERLDDMQTEYELFSKMVQEWLDHAKNEFEAFKRNNEEEIRVLNKQLNELLQLEKSLYNIVVDLEVGRFPPEYTDPVAPARMELPVQWCREHLQLIDAPSQFPLLSSSSSKKCLHGRKQSNASLDPTSHSTSTSGNNSGHGSKSSDGSGSKDSSGSGGSGTGGDEEAKSQVKIPALLRVIDEFNAMKKQVATYMYKVHDRDICNDIGLDPVVVHGTIDTKCHPLCLPHMMVTGFIPMKDTGGYGIPTLTPSPWLPNGGNNVPPFKDPPVFAQTIVVDGKVKLPKYMNTFSTTFHADRSQAVDADAQTEEERFNTHAVEDQCIRSFSLDGPPPTDAAKPRTGYRAPAKFGGASQSPVRKGFERMYAAGVDGKKLANDICKSSEAATVATLNNMTDKDVRTVIAALKAKIRQQTGKSKQMHQESTDGGPSLQGAESIKSMDDASTLQAVLGDSVAGKELKRELDALSRTPTISYLSGLRSQVKYYSDLLKRLKEDTTGLGLAVQSCRRQYERTGEILKRALNNPNTPKHLKMVRL